MEAFLHHHAQDVIGVLSGFDRLLFRGTLRSISYGEGLDRFLGAQHVRYKDFGSFAQRLSDQLKDHAQAMARAAGRPFVYLSSSRQSKEQMALRIAKEDQIKQGLVCVLRCVEPCLSFSIRRDEKSNWRFVGQERKCLHLYFYYMDRQFGLMHVRLQTWLPFGIQTCLNGREYLARRMEQAGIGFEQRDNCFVRIDDLPRAQAMMDELVHRKWDRLLHALARRVNPLPARLKLYGYYWSIRESEYATDVMFKDASSLAGLYPALLDHAIRRLGCHDVLRFLGRRTTPRRFVGEASTSLLTREEGTRVKHWAEENSIKMYDKQGSVLRIETTINNVRRFKVRRMTVRKGVRRMRWIPMRFGLADLVRRVEVSRAANERYLQALAEVNVPTPVRPLLDGVGRRMVKENRAYRALRPVSREEAEVFQAVLDGRFLVRGFTNRDLRQALWPRPPDSQQQHRQSGQMTRLLRLLRAHGMIRKVSGTRYYRVTSQGHKTMSAALILREADVTKLAA
jgi:DNA-binding PadR family transcriptional regulator